MSLQVWLKDNFHRFGARMVHRQQKGKVLATAVASVWQRMLWFCETLNFERNHVSKTPRFFGGLCAPSLAYTITLCLHVFAGDARSVAYTSISAADAAAV